MKHYLISLFILFALMSACGHQHDEAAAVPQDDDGVAEGRDDLPDNNNDPDVGSPIGTMDFDEEVSNDGFRYSPFDGVAEAGQDSDGGIFSSGADDEDDTDSVPSISVEDGGYHNDMREHEAPAMPTASQPGPTTGSTDVRLPDVKDELEATAVVGSLDEVLGDLRPTLGEVKELKDPEVAVPSSGNSQGATHSPETNECTSNYDCWVDETCEHGLCRSFI